MYTNAMAKSTLSVPKKKMGRPATGHDPSVTVRLPVDTLTQVEKWAENNGYSRSATVALAVELGMTILTAPAKPGRAAKRRGKPKAD